MDEIRKSHVLKAKSNPQNMYLELTSEAKNCARRDKYIVGLFDMFDSGWLKSGLMNILFQHIGDEIVTIECPIFNSNDTFVRDHNLFSPARYKELSGQNVDFLQLDLRLEIKHKFVKTMISDYYDSSILLKDYKWNYIAPEVWLAQNTPLNGCRYLNRITTEPLSILF